MGFLWEIALCAPSHVLSGVLIGRPQTWCAIHRPDFCSSALLCTWARTCLFLCLVCPLVASSELSTFSFIACTSRVSLKTRAVEGKGSCPALPRSSHPGPHMGLLGLPLGPSPAHGTVTAWAPPFFRTVSAPLGPSLLTVNFRVMSQVPGKTWFKGAVLPCWEVSFSVSCSMHLPFPRLASAAPAVVVFGVTTPHSHPGTSATTAVPRAHTSRGYLNTGKPRGEAQCYVSKASHLMREWQRKHLITSTGRAAPRNWVGNGGRGFRLLENAR